ncbi:MAG: hypothetical protein SGI73_14305 [Chloroflexota bacterium]|nr:hypothetical protein [Chloroflexota bacterium]
MNATSLPVAVIGAGPVGLAAVAHLIERGETPIVFEAGDTIAQFCGALTADAPPVTSDTLDAWLSDLDSPTRAVAVPPGCVADALE